MYRKLLISFAFWGGFVVSGRKRSVILQGQAADMLGSSGVRGVVLGVAELDGLIKVLGSRGHRTTGSSGPKV